MLDRLMDLKILYKFMAFYLCETLAGLLVVALGLIGVQEAKDLLPQAAASALVRYQVALVLVFLATAALSFVLTTLAARRMVGTVQALAEVAQALASGDLRATTAVRSRDELGAVAADLDLAMAKLRQEVGAIATLGERTAADSAQLAASAAEVDAATQEISAGADAQRLEMEVATRAIDAIAGMLEKIGAGITADVTQIEAMLKVGATGCSNVEESTRAMLALGESSAKVSAITNVIAELANQTNLLSLNAAIEAAKAMEYGRGFTVVAEEVRKLAERSGKAASDIAHLIQDSGARVQVGASSVKTVQDGLEALMATIQRQATGARGALAAVRQEVKESAVARDRMANALQITEANASATHQLSASISETTRTIQGLAGTASELRELTRRFRMA